MLIAALTAAAAVASGQAAAPALPGGRDGPQRVAPRGSYSQTCSGSYVNQGRLYADCRDERGRMRGSSILLSWCSDYEVRNIDGRLTCGPHRGDYEDADGPNRPDRPGRPDRPDRPDRPGGGWDNGGGWGNGNGNGGWGQSSVTVYRDSYFRGASATFNDAVPDLVPYGLNDEVSSLRLRGSWEICTDSYFRGNCQIVSGEVVDLVRWGVNDRISSMRPARRGW